MRKVLPPRLESVLSVLLMASVTPTILARSAEETIPFLEPGGRVRANSVVRMAVPQPNPEEPVLIDIHDPWGNTVWTGASREPAFFFLTREWADGTYQVRFETGEEVEFQVATEFIEQIRARAGLLLREIDKKRDPKGMPPEELWGASNLLQRVITEHVAYKPEDVVTGNTYFGELALGFRTETETIRLLGCGSANFMDGYADPYRPMEREASMLFMPPNTVIDFAARGEAMLKRWGYEIGDVDHILITHPHRDHFEPSAVAAFGQKRKDLGLPPPTLHSGKSVCNEMETYLSENELTGFVQIQELPLWEETEVGELRVKPVLANHGPPKDCYTYIIYRREATIFYGTDTGYPLPETYEALAAERFDVFVHELTPASAEDGITHTDLGDLRLLLSRLRADGAIDNWTRVVTTHQGLMGTQVMYDYPYFQGMLGFEPGYDGMPIPIAHRAGEP